MAKRESAALESVDSAFTDLEESLAGIGSSYDTTEDARVKIEVGEGGLTAYLFIIPPQAGGRMVELEDILGVAEESGILGIDKTAIREALSKKKFNTPILIAQGTPPRQGKKAALILQIKDKELVKREQLLLIKRKPGLGAPGISVKGKKMLGLLGEDVPIVTGGNVRTSEDGMKAYAAINGLATWDGQRVCIEEVPEISLGEEGELCEFLKQTKKAVRDSSLDAKLRIVKEIDRAYLVIAPPKPGGKMVQKEDVVHAIQFRKIYVDEKAIERMLSKGKFNTPLLIAQSVPPANGRDGRIVFKVEENQQVKKGDLLAVKEEPTTGIPGMALNGRELSAEDGREARFMVGENVVLSEDRTMAYAAIDGEVVLEGERIAVRAFQPDERPLSIDDGDLHRLEMKLDKFLEETKGCAHDPNLDMRIEVNVEEDIFAYLTIIPPKIGGEILEWDRARESLHRKGIPNPDEGVVQKALKNKKFNTPILIAQGTPPKKGEDGQVILKVRRGDKVKKGDLLAVKELPTEGVPGISIQGKTIPAEDGEEVEFNLGDNVRLGDNELEVYATTDGVFHIEGDNKIIAIVEEQPSVIVQRADSKIMEQIEKQDTKIIHNPALDAKVEVKVEEGDLAVYVVVAPARPGGRMVNLDDIRDALSEEGILNFDESAVTEALKNKKFNTPILIAQGTPPVKGKDARVIFKAKGGDRVNKGDLLAIKEHSTPGIPGVSVRGEKIQAEDGKDGVELLFGENVELGDDGFTIYATVDGEMYWDGSRMAVEELVESMSPGELEKREIEIEDLFGLIVESIEEIATGVSNLDGGIRLTLRQDGAEAYITITPPKIGGQAVTSKEIYQKLEEAQVTNIDDEAIKTALDKHLFRQPVLVAKGVAATQGEDAAFIYRYGIKGDKDLKEEAIAGQLLMIKKLATRGSPGKSVTGEEIPAKLGMELKVTPKRGVVLDEDGTRAYATTNGQVIWQGTALSVEKTREINTDVDKAVGDIDFEGRVTIWGSVSAGISIRATSDIEISQDVNEAEINSGGSLTVGGHLSKARVVARGDILAKGAKEADLETRGGVIISEEIKDCHIDASRMVISQGEKGQIVGGKIMAQGGIDAKVIGTEKRKKTTLLVSEGAKIKASSCIYPGVGGKIGDHKLEIKKPAEKVALSIVDGKIHEEGYEPSRIERTLLSDEKSPSVKIEDLAISVVVTSASVEEAKEMGAELLGLEEEGVEIQEIEEGEEREEKKFRIFVAGTILAEQEEEEVDRDIEEMLAQPQDENGSFRLVNLEEGLFLTVFAPVGNGEAVKEEMVFKETAAHDYKGIDDEEVKRIVEEASATPVKIGPRQYDPGIDGEVVVEIIDEGRKAKVTILPPKKGGIPVNFDRAMKTLKSEGIVAGIKEEVLRKIIKEEKFSTPTLIAEEIPPQRGEGIEIEYKFRVDQKINLVEDEEGRIDFHELGLIQNVHEGELLATKRLVATSGVPGKKITGEIIPAPTVADIKLPAGKNTIISEDGLELRAACDGQVIFSNERISVEALYEVKGDVNLATGNIDFLGTVDISGNVEDGFRVRAEGDVQIRGGVGKSLIRAGGTVAVGAGIQGADVAEIWAGRDVISKFIDSVRVVSKGSVIVAQEILHSFIDAEERVEVIGGRGSIIGGRIRAIEEVVVKTVGSEAGAPTIIEVGIKPKFRQQLFNLEGIFEKDYKRFEDLKINITGLRGLRQEKGLSEDKEELLNQLLDEQRKLAMKLRSYSERKEALEAELARATGGKITILETVYPEVRIAVRVATYVVKEPMSNVTFTFKDNRVTVTGEGE